MFSKSKRFVDEKPCAPGVGTYNLPDVKKPILASFHKSDRWEKEKEETSNSRLISNTVAANASCSFINSFNQVSIPAFQSTCKKKKNKTHVNLQDNDSCRRSLEADVEFQQSKVNALLQKIRSLETQLKETLNHSEEIENNNMKLHGLLDVLRQEKSQVTQANNELEEQILKLKAEYKILENLLEKETDSLMLLKREYDELESSHKLEEYNLEEKLRFSQELNCDFREQLESIEFSMTSNMKNLTDKYESLEETFGQVQDDYKNRLERSMSLVEKTRKAHESCRHDLETMNQVYSELKANYENVLNEIDEKDSKITELMTCVKILQDENASMSQEILKEKNLKTNLEEDLNERIQCINEQLEVKSKYCIDIEENHNSQMKEMLRNISEKQNDLKCSNTINQRLEEEIEKLKAQSIEFSENIKVLRKEVIETVDNSKQKDEEIQCLLQNRQESETRYKNEIQALARKELELSEDYQSKLDSFQSLLSETEMKLVSTEVHLKETEAKLSLLEQETTQYATQISSMKGELVDTQQKLMETTKRLTEQEIELTMRSSEPANSVAGDELEKVRDEMMMWKNKFEILEQKVSPFMNQLDEFELERQILLNENSLTQKEMQMLSHKYAQILGHQNNKQKIHHIENLKQENLNLKTEVMKLKTAASKDKLKIARYENKTKTFDSLQAFNHVNKENTKQPLKQANS